MSPSLCQVNGLLREYIISRSMEENLVFALEGSSRKSLHRTGRHLAIHESWDRDQNVFKSLNFSRLRSLTVFGAFFISDKNKMELLRVLDLEDTSGVTNTEVERMVKLLPLLKFLSLRRCVEITHLPDSLGNLKQLQTLDVRGTDVTKLPKSIIKLEKLQYIRAGATLTMEGDASTPSPSESPSSDNDNGNVERVPPSTPPPPATESTSVSGDGNGVVETPTPTPPPAAAAAKCKPGANLVPDCLSKLWGQRRLDGGSHNGVRLPPGIGKLSNLHTLGVVNIIAAAKDGVLEELKNLTQLHKLGVSGINQNNIQMFFSAISRLAHLKCLSLQLQIDADNQRPGCLDAISMKPMKNVRSLKLYGLLSKLPVWIKEFPNVKNLSLQMTMVRQDVIDSLESVGFLGSLRLFVAKIEEDKLQFSRSGPRMVFLEISSNTRSKATIMFTESSDYPQVLRIRCGRVSPLQISGLEHLYELKEVWVSGPCDNDHKEHFYSERRKYPERTDQANLF
nr:unnamed protein product [Digitaria exilis]